MTTAFTPSSAREASLLHRLRYTPLRDVLRGRLTARLDVRALVAQAGLPARLGELVREVVRRTRLWRLEQVDVARELVAHFQDGLEAGASAEDLATSFGDLKQVARLIRRAKKRHRPLAWKVWKLAERLVGLAFLLVVAVYAVQAVRIYAHSPNIARNFLAEWNRPALAVPEVERAWAVYRAAALATGKWPEYRRNADLKPGGEKWPEMAAFAAENREAIELYRRAAAMPTLGAVLGPAAYRADQEIYRRNNPAVQTQPAGQAEGNENPDFIYILVPQGTVLREGARLLAVDAYLAATEDDADRVLADVSALCGMTEQAYQMRFLITDLVALRIAGTAGDVVGTLLHDRPQLFDDARLTELAHRLASLGGPEGLRVTFASECAMFDDLIQRYYTDDGHGDGLPRPGLLPHLACSYGFNWPGGTSGAPAAALTPALSALMAGRREMSTKFHGLLARYEAEVRVPLWQRQAQDVDRELESMAESPLDRLRYLPIVTLMPALGRAASQGEYAIQVRDATLTAIALEFYRRHHGSWPASLQELTPRLLPQVPPDRYDGKPLKYRLVAGQPRLYSVGVDRKDDGGRVPRSSTWICPARRRPAPEGDWVLWPPVE